MRRNVLTTVVVIATLLYFFGGIKHGAVELASTVHHVNVSVWNSVSSFEPGFVLGILGLTAVYLAIALTIFGVTARIKGQSLLEYFDEIDEVFRVISLVLVITFLIACYHEKGPALALPKKYSAKGLNEIGNFLTNIFWGSDMKTQFDGDHPAWTTTGSWFWWQATGTYLVAWFVICWEAFFHGLGAVWGVIQRYRTVMGRRTPHTTTATTGGGAGTHLFGAMAGWAGFHFLFEIAEAFVEHFMARRRAARP